MQYWCSLYIYIGNHAVHIPSVSSKRKRGGVYKGSHLKSRGQGYLIYWLKKLVFILVEVCLSVYIYTVNINQSSEFYHFLNSGFCFYCYANQASVFTYFVNQASVFLRLCNSGICFARPSIYFLFTACQLRIPSS
jgi:hypothetical protein